MHQTPSSPYIKLSRSLLNLWLHHSSVSNFNIDPPAVQHSHRRSRASLMLFLHLLLFFTFGTFTVAAPVVSAPVSLHPRAFNLPQNSSPSSPIDSSPPKDDIGEAYFKEQMAGYWFSWHVSFGTLFFFSPGSAVDLIYLDSAVQLGRNCITM